MNNLAHKITGISGGNKRLVPTISKKYKSAESNKKYKIIIYFFIKHIKSGTYLNFKLYFN